MAEFEQQVRAARRVLVLGIGGGGDVVGALAVARRCEQLGAEFVLGGVAWERMPIDPHPGPRPIAEIAGAKSIGTHAVLAGPDTATPEDVRFSEAHIAAHLDAPTVLIDVTAGALGAAEGIGAAARELACDLIVHVDIGGDAVATGGEAALASPLCDAVMLAGSLRLAAELPQAGAILGAACDGELTPVELMERIAAIARRGAWTGAWGVTWEVAAEIERAAGPTGTEASLCIVRCVRGEYGETAIRGGRRRVELTPLGALAFTFDPAAAAAELPLARAVLESTSIEEAHESLLALGVGTELAYERGRATEIA